MRSLIILEVEHGEDTDSLQLLIESIPSYTTARLLNYTVRVDLPECFRLDSR